VARRIFTPAGKLWPLWVLGTRLCLLGAYIGGANWAALFLSIRNAERGIGKRYSQSPAIGPLFAYFGLSALPIHKSPWIWLVLGLDPSTWIVLMSIPYLYRQALGKPGLYAWEARLRDGVHALARKWMR
jgi:hypothetical protein